MAILLKAIDFLCELKRYLNNLVHFFNSVQNLVCISMREAADDFIRMVKDATMIENGRTPQIGGVTLDAWARQVPPSATKPKRRPQLFLTFDFAGNLQPCAFGSQDQQSRRKHKRCKYSLDFEKHE